MEFWIEGTPAQVVEVANLGLADAIATNPAIMERWTADGRTLEQVVSEVCAQTRVPVYVQLRGPTIDAYLREMDSLRQISERIHPKLVATHDGMAATRRIAADGLKPLITTLSTLNQAYLAARSHAVYVAPYVGRIGDSGADPYQLVADIAALYERHSITTQIAAASIRSPQQAEAVLRAGAPVLVMPYDVFLQMPEAPLTRAWIEGFDGNWTRIPHGLGEG